MTTNFTDTEITRYLLGELTADIRASLAEACADDPAFFTRVAEIEDDLIDDYVRGKLNIELRGKFERHYLTHPARSERVQLAKILLSKLEPLPHTAPSPQPTKQDPSQAPSPTFWRKLFPHFPVPALATILLMGFGGGWLLYKTARLQNELEEQRAARIRGEQRLNELQQQNERLSAEVGRLQNQPVPGQPTPSPEDLAGVVTLQLPTSQVMSGAPGSATPTLTLSSGIKQARLQFAPASGDYSRYQAVLQTADGTTILEQPNVIPRRRASTSLFSISVPADKLASGEYILTLRGIKASSETDTLAKALFRVRKK
ncbi:MAG TPA: hypothetical protein PLD20_10215 [Blastocatellia bacterium]|nr:hypothetical protein [Blastocatellia bacterium]HMV81898.1 hypothetical protein [Blastocatellia bacterium]HMX25211.1 hypothetical protein [Blastocatellia bacterium]HMY71099.1 hypothetical protein [Blastocatellia bacterium]HMZ18292.1 hypothetical protein [Blastocatellia bacterium]